MTIKFLRDTRPEEGALFKKGDVRTLKKASEARWLKRGAAEPHTELPKLPTRPQTTTEKKDEPAAAATPAAGVADTASNGGGAGAGAESAKTTLSLGAGKSGGRSGK